MIVPCTDTDVLRDAFGGKCDLFLEHELVRWHDEDVLEGTRIVSRAGVGSLA